MVRQKSRWLLIRIEYESEVKNISSKRDDIAAPAVATATTTATTTTTTTATVNTFQSSSYFQQQPGDTKVPFQKTTTTDMVRIQLYHSIRCTMEDAFGITASGITEDIQDTGLAVIKVPRDSSNLVRSAITIMMQVNGMPMVATVLSTNGSARTAKLAAMRELKCMFGKSQEVVPTQQQQQQPQQPQPQLERLKKLQEYMDQVRCIE